MERCSWLCSKSCVGYVNHSTSLQSSLQGGSKASALSQCERFSCQPPVDICLTWGLAVHGLTPQKIAATTMRAYCQSGVCKSRSCIIASLPRSIPGHVGSLLLSLHLDNFLSYPRGCASALTSLDYLLGWTAKCVAGLPHVRTSR